MSAKALPLAAINIRDPFILADLPSKAYYMYAADPVHDGVMVYQSRDLRQWDLPKTVFTRTATFWGGKEIWAPEVHHFGDWYYLFVTFNRPNGRGTAILRAKSPLGPFQIFSEDAGTPPDQQCLDGTSWVDANGQNWLIYSEEWIRIHNGVIRAVRMSRDWAHREGESLVLFHASEAAWVSEISPGNYVTDGPYLFQRPGGPLRMIWSSFTKTHQYAVGLAESKSGQIIGPWTQAPEPLSQADGGHGMIFRDFADRLLMVFHMPNSESNERAHVVVISDSGPLHILPAVH